MKKILVANTVALLALICFGFTAAHASEITGSLSGGAPASSPGGTSVGSIGGTVGAGSTITGTVGAGSGGGGNTNTITGTITGGGGGSALGVATVGSGTGSPLIAQGVSSPSGQVLGVATVAEPGLPNTGEAFGGADTSKNVAMATIAMSLSILGASLLALYFMRKRKIIQD